MEQDSLLRIFESIPEHVNRNAHLVHRGRYMNARLKISLADVPYLMEIRDGKIAQLTRTFPLFQTTDLVISAGSDAWAALWEKFPKAGWHDIFALHKRGAMQIEGESQVLFSNLQYLKDVLNTPRLRHGA
ncbi:hypothetical protein [Diaphorobacter aerolatus]|uniref:SCP2 sterol-binding domain-containing protein n=1 Tax=Diaphorobacter aerolatus TaxID=1288495 RepID=A0A7H0GKC9_9BURK|nr:hypothetical protein [Diaphorobacter aerolatus]QNP48745.1 hypothetical protein H9K75_00315 [Diaphorobacter aerolatus]